ncbi:MAG: T9SS type A sorting domain-containing protein [Fibrobacter sp.]|nr:T9SS type A sorting domain-containing protein [Fibrobacter sp.]
MTKTPKLLSAACLLAFCGSVSAYTITGTVSDDQGKALRGVSVSLLKEGKNATTDRQGKYTIHEDEITTPPADSPGVAIHPAFRNTVGYISINNGILSYSQSSTSPVQVKIYNSLGNQVFKKLLQGSGTYDLSKGIGARGTYFAQVSVGNAKQNFKFTTDRGFSSSIGSRANGNALLKEAEKGEALRFVADGYDTLTVPLGTLDTTVDVKLTKIATEQTYAFGYPLKNDPTPSKGCGKDNTLKNYFKFTGGGIEHEVYLDLPENYDKNKPYRLVFGMHCMGGSAQNVAKNEHYYGYRDKDKKNTIFVAPHGYTDQMPWRCGDNKDHLFFDEILTYLNENLCVDTSRVFSSGFSFGAMYSNSLAQTFQHRLRGVVVFATADQVIYIPKNAGKPIAWMGTVGLSDGTCPPSMGRSARDRILRNNGPEGHTDCTSEKATEFSGGGGHVCYDYKTVDPRFPVKWCTFNGGHQWDMRENGKLWASDIGWEFITQF